MLINIFFSILTFRHHHTPLQPNAIERYSPSSSEARRKQDISYHFSNWAGDPCLFMKLHEPDECRHFLLFCDKCVGQWSQTFQRLVSPTVRPPDCSVEAFYIWSTFCANSSLLLHKMHHRHLAHEQHLCSVTLNFTSYRCTLWLENVNQQSAQSLFSHQILKNVIPIGTRKEKWYCLLLHVQFPLLKLSQLLG